MRNRTPPGSPPIVKEISSSSFDFSQLSGDQSQSTSIPRSQTEKPPSDYEGWLRALFPSYVAASFAPRHHEFWQWVWALQLGVRPETSPVLLWPRGGSKSTSVELACAAVAARKTRTYVLYISGTQKQADDHVANVARLLESDAIGRYYPDIGERKLSKFGSSLGWRRNRVMTESGFIVDALGLDGAGRGVKLDEFRPDLFVLDDVDDVKDSQETVRKNILTLTQSLLPAEAPTAGAVFVQNVVHYESIAARLAGLASESAEFLADREVSGPIPAVVGLQTERIPGTFKHRIVSGTPTWDGQDIQTCENQINRWSLRAFLAEAQHERTPPEGQAFPEFDVSVHVCEPFKVPETWPRWRAVDYGYAVPYGCLWFARAPTGRIYVYRETYATRLTAMEQAYQVRLASAGEHFRLSLGDPAMWASQREGHRFQSVADQYGEMGVALTRATNDRLSGKALVHRALEWGEGVPPVLQIFRTCHNLIRTLPMLPVDPNKPEDVDCWVAGTVVSTPDGPVPVERVAVGSLVDTPIGPRAVGASYYSGKSETVRVELSDGRVIEGTPKHKIYVRGKGLVPLDDLVCYDTPIGRTTWSRWLSIGVSCIVATKAVSTTTRTAASWRTVARVCIDRFGSMPVERFRPAGIFTTLMATMTTMSSLTLSASRPVSMESITMSKGSTVNWVQRWQHGERVQVGRQHSEPMVTRCWNACRYADSRAEIVALLLKRDTLRRVCARLLANMPLAIGKFAERVRSAVSSSGAEEVRRNRPKPAHIVAVGRSDARKPVFNLTVVDAHLFYANGVLSSNTATDDHLYDCTRYGLQALKLIESARPLKQRQLVAKG